MHRKRSRLWALLLLLILPWSLAQSYPPRIGPIASDSVLLNAAAIDRAAETLGDLGVDALALYIEAPLGATLDDAERYFEGALARYGLAPDQSYLIVFVGTAELTADGVRPLFIEVGTRLESRLGDPGFVDVLRAGVVTPRLVAGDPSGAFVAAFEAVADALAPQAPGEAQPRAPTEPLPEPEGTRFAWELVLLLLVAIVVALWWRGRRGRSAAGVDGEALQAVQGQLSQLLIDLSGGGASGTPALPADPEQQTDFVLIRDLLRGTDPDRMDALTERYRQGTERLRGVEAGFEALREGDGDAAEQLERARALLVEAEGVRDFAVELSSLWGELQREAGTVPERLDRIRARSAALRAALVARFQAADSEAVLAHLDALSARAESGGERRGLEAAEVVTEAEAEAARLERALEDLTDAHEGLSDLGEDLEAWSEQGFATASWARRREAELRRVEGAVAALGDRSTAAQSEIAAAVEGGTGLVAELETEVALQRRNGVRIEALRERGASIVDRSERGAVAFDAVDDFAESNWSDIRGNGSEAQAAAGRAEALVERAAELNTLMVEGAAEVADRQDVAGAAAALDDAERELDQVEALVAAITERLSALREAQATGRRHLEAVESELAELRSRLAAPEVDRMVGEGPEATLAEGERLAAQARAALATDRPDWLAAIAAIQRADRAADTALAAQRQEREAMERLQLRLVSERDEAQSARSRSVHFLRVHAADLSRDTLALGDEAAAAFERASTLAARSDLAEEEALAALLAEAATAFDAAQSAADRAFAAAESEFSAAEALRRETAAGVAEIEADLDSLGRYLRRHGLGSDLSRLVGELARSLPNPRGLGGGRLGAVSGELASLRGELARVRAEAERQVERRESALRQERRARLERERRRRAAERARQSAGWGGSPLSGGSTPRPPRPSGSGSRIPTVGRPKSPVKPASSRRRAGGGWGGPKRSKGGW
jgi:hypothetical protein